MNEETQGSNAQIGQFGANLPSSNLNQPLSQDSVPEQKFAAPVPPTPLVPATPASAPIPTPPTPSPIDSIQAKPPQNPVNPPAVPSPESQPAPTGGHFETLPPTPQAIEPVGTNINLGSQMPQSTRPQMDFKKIVIIYFSVIVGLAILGGLGYLGYVFYVKSSDSRILNKAAQNILAAQNLKADFTIGSAGVSLKGEVAVDSDQDIKWNLKSDVFPLEGLYIKKEDKGYVGELSFGSDSGLKSKKYMEYKNVYKALEKYGLSEAGLDSLNPQKNYFNATNVKYFKNVGKESWGGRNYYKYSFEPDEAGKAEGLKKANETYKKLSKNNEIFGNMELKSFETTTNIWIGQNDFKIYKVEGNNKGSYTYELPAATACYTEIQPPSGSSFDSAAWAEYDKKMASCQKNPKKITKDQKFDMEWSLLFDYSFKENIQLPKDAKIESSFDLLSLPQPSTSEIIKSKIKLSQLSGKLTWAKNLVLTVSKI